MFVDCPTMLNIEHREDLMSTNKHVIDIKHYDVFDRSRTIAMKIDRWHRMYKHLNEYLNTTDLSAIETVRPRIVQQYLRCFKLSSSDCQSNVFDIVDNRHLCS
jgi:hypothetical protein